jgi:hypothetical protein
MNEDEQWVFVRRDGSVVPCEVIRAKPRDPNAPKDDSIRNLIDRLRARDAEAAR